MLLLDTSVAVQLRDLDPDVAARVASQSASLAMSLMTVVELEGGIAASAAHAMDRQRSLDNLLTRIIVLPFDQTIVRAYARILRRTGFSRRNILDRLIAATALVHDLTLVTINGPDFHDIPDLKLEVWSTATQ